MPKEKNEQLPNPLDVVNPKLRKAFKSAEDVVSGNADLATKTANVSKNKIIYDSKGNKKTIGAKPNVAAGASRTDGAFPPAVKDLLQITGLSQVDLVRKVLEKYNEDPDDMPKQPREEAQKGLSKEITKADLTDALVDNLRWYIMPKVRSAEEFQERLNLFLQYTLEHNQLLTFEKACLATGYSARTVKGWAEGLTSELGNEVQEMASHLLELIHSYDAELSVKGKINPIVYIFRARNYYGMKNVDDINITYHQNEESNASVEELMEKYKAAMPQIEYEDKTKA